MKKMIYCMLLAVGLLNTHVLAITPEEVDARMRAPGTIKASGQQGTFSAKLAYDGDANTFWVSSGSPSRDNPQWLSLSFDAPKKVDNLQITGRKGYGPHKGEIQVSADGVTWESVTSFTMGDGAAYLAKVDKTAKQLRAVFYSAYDQAKLPAKARNVQVAELKLNVPAPVPYGVQKLSADLPGLSISTVGSAHSANSVNANILRQSSIVSDATHQYTAYYDASGTVVLAKRALGSDQWETKRTQYTGNIRDAHNIISLGLDGDGYLHMSWDHHGHPLRYVRGLAPGSLELGKKMKMTGKFENQVTYPEFYNLPNGDLLFLYRDGRSGRGNLLLNRYDVATKKWTQVHSNFISGEGKQNAYWQMCMDKNGTIHVSWVWRKHGGVETNHDMGYAKSTDGGKTWQKSTGEPYVLPITAATAEYAARIPQKHELINTTGICADQQGNPYIVTYFRPTGTKVPQYHLIYNTGSEWKTVQVSQRTTPFSLSGGGTKKIPISRPRILAQVSGGKTSAYMFFRDIERDNRISVAICADLKTPSWEMKDLTETSVSMWEPSLDSAAWQRDQTVYLFAQRVEQGDGETSVASKPSEVAIIKWKPENAKGSVKPCFARFVPERLDDFAWENDRITFRMYGPKMWTMPKKRCGSGIDVWVKKVRYPIIDKWYARKHYHEDKGEGADLYSVGKTLGCGGLGYMVDGKLEINRHYESYKVIQGEGDRIEFELTYAPLDVGGKTVTETKRISMEAGSNLFTVRTTFKVEGGGSVKAAAGIVLRKGDDELRHGKNWISYAEPMSAKDGQTYCGVVFEKEAEFKKTDGHALMLVSVKDGETLTYRAGAAWSKGLDFKNMNAWTAYLEKAAGAKTLAQNVDCFSDWPAGKSPAEIGHAVSENFLKRGHYETMEKKHNQKARYQTWGDVVYPEVCVWFGALKVARESGDDALAQQLVDRLNRYAKDPKKFPFKFHVDHSVNGVIPLEVYRLTNEDKYLKMGMKRVEDQWSKTTPDGITAQARYWVDDIYMIAAIQAAAFRVTGDQKYLDRAALTIATYLKKLQKEDGLFWHAEDSPFVWGRGAGWYAAGMTEILKYLPPENPHYAPILAGYKKMMAALLQHQSESGMWRQLVDKPASWEETSSTGMFAYAMVTGVKRGWLDEETYGPVARKAWLALVDQLDENGNIKNVCVGTNKAFKEAGSDLDAQYEFYLARPRYTGDYHGQAPVLWTAAALLEGLQE